MCVPVGDGDTRELGAVEDSMYAVGLQVETAAFRDSCRMGREERNGVVEI